MKNQTPHKFDFRSIKEGDYVAWNHNIFQSAVFEFGRCIKPPRFAGSQRFAGKIVKSILNKKNRHAFTIELSEPLEFRGQKKIVYGVQLFPNLIEHIPLVPSDKGELDA